MDSVTLLPVSHDAHAVSPGWMDCRAATCIEIEIGSDAYLIHTNLHGIDGETLQIHIQGEYLIIEGRIEGAGPRRGRFVRRLGSLDGASVHFLEVSYQYDGLLLLRVPRQCTG